MHEEDESKAELIEGGAVEGGKGVEVVRVVDGGAEAPYATPPRDPSKDRVIIAWTLLGILAGGLGVAVLSSHRV